jgi:nucleoside-diphosphate-sugar epimerase
MRVLVTGGTGFTGTALVRRLISAGHQVVALDYKDGLQCDSLRAMGAEVVLGSVTDRAVVQRSMKGVEYVFHLAAAFRELNVPNSFYDDVNVNGTRIVAEEAMRAGAWISSTAAPAGSTGTWITPRPTRTLRSSRRTTISVPSTRPSPW